MGGLTTTEHPRNVVAMDTNEEQAIDARDQFRELGAAIVVTMLAVTWYGLNAPTRIEERTATSPIQDPVFDWLPILLIAGAFFGTWLAWVIVVERRLPWPFGERRKLPPGSAWAAIPNAIAFLASLVVSSWMPSASGTYFREGGESWLEVFAPADLARNFVLFALFWSIAYPIGALVDSFVARRRRARTAARQISRPAA
jgi:hypothetical protein